MSDDNKETKMAKGEEAVETKSPSEARPNEQRYATKIL